MLGNEMEGDIKYLFWSGVRARGHSLCLAFLILIGTSLPDGP
jgi:hypothetical protein